MQEELIFALHGFLGQAKDWEHLKNLYSGKNLLTPSLFAEDGTLAGRSLTAQAEIVMSLLNEKGPKRLGGKKTFVGYSLGGRIGLHILQLEPDIFDQYIFLSTHPGLAEKDIDTRNKRRVSDEKWAAELTEENWEVFLSKWNAQPVLAGSSEEPERCVSDYSLKKLRLALTDWSLAHQADMRDIIYKNREKIIWVVGAHDLKYLELGKELERNNLIKRLEVFKGGHRLHLECADQLAKLLKPG